MMSDREEQEQRSDGRAYGVPSRRARVIDLLTEAYARNDLDEGEFERRVELAEQARTIEELDRVVADFPPGLVAALEAEAVAPRPGSPPGISGVRSPVPLTADQLRGEVARLDSLPVATRFNLLGDLKVLVRREDERVVKSVSLLGDCTVDLRDLGGEGGAVLVKSVSLLGDTRVLVTPGTTVEVRLFGLIGDQERRREGGFLKRLGRKLGISGEEEGQHPKPPGPTVVITGFRLIGDTVIVEG